MVSPLATAKPTGLVSAATILVGWSTLFYHANFQVHVSPATLPDVALTLAFLEFFYTGLFITAHDAIHGSVCPGNPRLNESVGRLFLLLFAMFDYDVVSRKHWEHHNHTGIPRRDPDFHKGDPRMLRWFRSFMSEYYSWKQFTLSAALTTLLLALGAPYFNVVMFVALAPILSAFRLFYFGTYWPHHPTQAGEVMGWEKSRSSEVPGILAFLACYNFVYHYEHHERPWLPWFQLAGARIDRSSTAN